jgi:hypothetical protein
MARGLDPGHEMKVGGCSEKKKQHHILCKPHLMLFGPYLHLQREQRKDHSAQ